MNDHQPKNPAASIFRLELPEISYRDDLEQPVLDMLFALLRLEVEDKPKPLQQRKLESVSRKALKRDPSDQEAQWGAMLAKLMKKHPDSRRRKDPVQAFMLPRLAVFWEWKTGKRPALTFVESFDYGPSDDFFIWAAELLVDKIPNISEKHSGNPVIALANRLWAAFKKLKKEQSSCFTNSK